ncbi:thermonuclease family protein [Erythrobacter ani]|uniref:Nuclease n=1 Tax=Erythrobacter ani TaxID=2827235 RepID=A0ABS6SJT9_9SPHN|nr:hypothetical protein [Erythrobacter ani]MBV7265270.1 hypothetical protein [Erythrobacter ani]
MLWRTPALLVIVSAAWWFLYRPYVHEQGWVKVADEFALCGEPWSGAAGCVVDGDTIVIGNGRDRRRVRLTGFDAPELNGACAAETERAQDARRALHDWLSRGPFEWNGDIDPPRDQYGRELREVRRVLPDGSREYVGRVLVDRNLASDNGWEAIPTDWCS